MLTLITQSGDVSTFISCFGQMTVSIGLIDPIHLSQGSFLWTSRTSKSFKLPNFSAPRSYVRIAWMVEIERHLFSLEVNCHTVTCCAYKVERRWVHLVPSLPILFPSNFSLLAALLPLLTPWPQKLLTIFPSPMRPPVMMPRATPGRRTLLQPPLLH
jgi:hypothetical protein